MYGETREKRKFSVRRVSFRFVSFRFNSIRFDSIRLDSTRLDSTRLEERTWRRGMNAPYRIVSYVDAVHAFLPLGDYDERIFLPRDTLTSSRSSWRCFALEGARRPRSGMRSAGVRDSAEGRLFRNRANKVSRRRRRRRRRL